MVKFFASVAVIVFGSAAYAQGTPPHPHGKHTKKPAAATQTVDDPDDMAKVPANVQKWVGGAVDDILTGADKTLGEPAGKR